MIEKMFKYASASEAGDYYQVVFDNDEDDESINGPYLLIQQQFEFFYDGSYYFESDDSRLCGHFKVRAATLNSEFLSVELLAEAWTTLRVRYVVAQNDERELKRIVRIMFEKVPLISHRGLARDV